MDFIALDFETANKKHAPCSIGVVLVENNLITKEFYSLINPKQQFEKYLTTIHGITIHDVAAAPTFPEVWEEIRHYFKLYPVVAHNAYFDKTVLEKAIMLHELFDTPPIVYYDTMDLYLHNFPDAESSAMPSVCSALNIEYKDHHNALADAKMAAEVMIFFLSSCEAHDIFPHSTSDVSEFRNNMRYDDYSPLEPECAPELVGTTAIFDEVAEIVFDESVFVITGTTQGYSRPELENIIKERNGKIGSGVTRKTNYVIVGLQDLAVIKDVENAKSNKILRAEKYRSEGFNIKIIDSDAFLSAIAK